MMHASKRTLLWSLAASTALHASAVLGPPAGSWRPWQPAAPRPYLLEARLAPVEPPKPAAAAPAPPKKKQPSKPKAAKPQAKVNTEPAPRLDPQPESEPKPANEQLARAQEPGPQQPPKPAEPVPAPRAILQANAPEYPPAALAQRIVGCVLAEIYVDDAGRVERIEIAGSTHPGLFDESVRNAYRENFYIPAEKNGRAVRARVLGIASFELEGFAPLLCELYFLEQAREINARPYP